MTKDFGIKLERVPKGTRFVLPPRDLGAAARLGWIGIVIGTVMTLFMFAWMYGPISSGIEDLQRGIKFGWIGILFGMTGLIGLFVAFKAFSGGISVLRNRSHTEVIIGDDELICFERLGWVRFKTKTPFSKMEAIEISQAFLDTDRQSGKASIDFGLTWLPDDLMEINLNEESKPIASGYQIDVVRHFAGLLRHELQSRGMSEIAIVDRTIDTSSRLSNVATEDGRSGLTASNSALSGATRKNSPQLPADSDLEETDLDGATVYRVPSRGLWKGSHGLFAFALLWNGFMAVFSSVMFAGLTFQNSEEWFMVLFVSLFWIIGIGLMVGAFYIAKQSAMVGVRDERLFIERKTIFGTKWIEFDSDQVISIEVGNSNVEVNDVPVKQLQIFPAEQDKVGLFSQLSNPELEWLAHQLRTELDLDSDRQAWVTNRFDLDQELTPPATSKVAVI